MHASPKQIKLGKRQMNSNRPYLIRAIYQWIIDNNCTPYLMVDAKNKQLQIPSGLATDNRIVLNIAPRATRNLYLGDREISFNARFSSVPFMVHIPIDAVLMLYAQENGQGMLFSEEELVDEGSAEGQQQSSEHDDPCSKPKKPHLKLIK